MMSEERAFDLKMVFQNDKIITLKTYLEELGVHIDKISEENQHQLWAMEKLVNLVTSSIPVIDKQSESLKMRIRKRRGLKMQQISSAISGTKHKDVILFGSQHSSKGFKHGSEHMVVNVTDEDGNLIRPEENNQEVRISN